jgi:hypothetical protein
MYSIIPGKEKNKRRRKGSRSEDLRVRRGACFLTKYAAIF